MSAVLTVVAVGAVASGIEAEKGAKAAGGAALAQQKEARRQQDLAMSAAESPQELATLERGVQAQERNIARQERLVDAIDPALVEAAGQALKLLQGKEAASVSPVRRQRDRQRNQLVDRLREQLGPGAESSSAGIQALNQFDMQTDQLISGAQQQTLGQLLGTAQGARPDLARETAILGQLGGRFGAAAQRKVGAVTGTAGAVTGSAGAEFVQSQLSAQGRSKAFGQIAGAFAGSGGFGFGEDGGIETQGEVVEGGFAGNLRQPPRTPFGEGTQLA